MMGKYTLQHWSSTQTTVALSSAEAELTGICRGASKGIGLRSLCNELGLNVDLVVHTDAAAAIGICRRRGLGKVRHLAVADLWVQDKIKSKDFALQKIKGTHNPADILTKHIDAPTLHRHLENRSMGMEQGRAESAPTLTH